MSNTVPCQNPAHEVQFHIAGTAAASECARSATVQPAIALPSSVPSAVSSHEIIESESAKRIRAAVGPIARSFPGADAVVINATHANDDGPQLQGTVFIIQVHDTDGRVIWEDQRNPDRPDLLMANASMERVTSIDELPVDSTVSMSYGSGVLVQLPRV